MAEGSERYRSELAKEILAEPDKQKRREILELAKQSERYQGVTVEHRLGPKSQEVLPSVPEGWYTMSALMSELGAKKSVLQPLINQVRHQNPQSVKKYKNKVGNTQGIYDCYSPELKQLIETELQKQREVPEGWATINTVASQLGVGYNFVNTAVQPYRESNPGYFKMYRPKVGKPADFLDPELVRIVTEWYKRYEKAPEGWFTVGSLRQTLDADSRTINRIIDLYRSTNPGWFKVYYDVMTKPREHISPQLVDILKRELSKEEFVPVGWLTRGELSREIKESYKVIETIAEKYRSTNPDWFKNFKHGKHKIFEYYSPDLIEKIKKELSERPPIAPEGWMNRSMVNSMFKVQYDNIAKIVNPYRETNPNWFKKFRKDEEELEYYSPELIEKIQEVVKKRIEAPAGWETRTGITRLAGVDNATVEKVLGDYRNSNPEWFKKFYSKKGGELEYCDPQLVSIVVEYFRKRKIPQGWLTTNQLADKFQAGFSTITRSVNAIVKIHPEWVKVYRAPNDKEYSYYAPEVYKELDGIFGLETGVPEGWIDLYAVAELSKRGRKVVGPKIARVAAEHPEWVKEARPKKKGARRISVYAPELVNLVIEEVNKEKVEIAPEGWLTNKSLARMLSTSERSVGEPTTKDLAESYRAGHPAWFGQYKNIQGQVYEHYAPELVEIITKIFNLSETAKEGWLTNTELAVRIGRNPTKVKDFIEPYRRSNPEWFKYFKIANGRVLEHFAPELINVVTEALYGRSKLREKFNDFVKDVPEGDTEEAREFIKLLELFGNSNVVDILYKFHPHYRGLPMREVKSILSDYLGDFLYQSRNFKIENLTGLGVEFLEDENFRNHLYEVLKKDAFVFYNQLRKSDKSITPKEAVKSYLLDFRNRVGKIGSLNVDAVLDKFEAYYNLVFEGIEKPSNLVEMVGPNRPFPDFAQAININELMDKQKLLIADEMGVGKSASAILAKEYAGVPLAVIVAPSNVIDTWLEYLSDKITPEGKQVGYFKEGQAPRVLVVEDLSTIRDVDSTAYDYIIISQEKLNASYTAELLKVDFQMLIVDEVHKLKNVKEGVRSKNLLKLAEKIKDQDQYLALLSGTPVPNKVKDLAIVLKLLYPDEFRNVEESKLVRQIIYSDVLDLRAKLLPRMEMKALGENVDMPELTEETINIELSEIEKDIYQLLLDEDELEATEKIKILRQFLLNPEMLDATPGIPSAKVSKAGKELRTAFEHKDKVVMFVNGYVQDIIRGEDSIIPRLNLPSDVEIRVIHGEVSRTQRRLIQEELKQPGRKILLLVSGQTADVGVDFSAGEEVYFYNEPWTMAEEKQQLARVYRPGLTTDLKSRTFVAENTIEEGMRLYIQAKQKAIEKLIKGIPRTEIENKLLEEGEKQDAPNLEVNPELAKYYFSDWDKMMRIFAYVKQIGEKNFTEFLSKFGQEYARCYLELGSRSYQANAARICATFIENTVKESGKAPDEVLILDLASGPEMLKKHMIEGYQDRVISLDINQEHFRHAGNNRVVGSFLNVPLKDESVDFANMNFALHYTQFVPSRSKFERLEALMELSRVLKVGGTGVINMIYSLDYKNESVFKEILGILGFEVDEDRSGDITVGKNYKSNFLVIRKAKNLPVSYDETEAVEQLIQMIGKGNFDGLKLVENKEGLRDSRKIIQSFKLGDKKVDVNFNRQDSEILNEEQEIEKDGTRLKQQYGGIEKIPREGIIESGFTRILIKDKYILFKKLKKGDGVVVIK